MIHRVSEWEFLGFVTKLISCLVYSESVSYSNIPHLKSKRTVMDICNCLTSDFLELGWKYVNNDIAMELKTWTKIDTLECIRFGVGFCPELTEWVDVADRWRAKALWTGCRRRLWHWFLACEREIKNYGNPVQQISALPSQRLSCTEKRAKERDECVGGERRGFSTSQKCLSKEWKTCTFGELLPPSLNAWYLWKCLSCIVSMISASDVELM